MIKKFTIRSARKVAHISNRYFSKATRLTQKVEDKATRILSGLDYTFKTDDTISLEKIYYSTLPYVTPINPSLPPIGSQPAIVLFLPTLDDKSFFGGTSTALIVAGKSAIISKRRLRIVQTLKTGHNADLSGFFALHGLSIPKEDITVLSVADRKYDVYGYIPMNPEDVFIASAWWDAHLISQLPIKNKFIYLVQDFEPIFYNNSDLYVLAEQTYKNDGFVALCNTQLMHDFMKERAYPIFKGTQSFWFEPAVSRIESGEAIEKATNEKKRLFIYGRPNVHRNLFFNALNSVDLAIKSGGLEPSEWEFYMAGQDNIPDIKLSSGAVIQNLGKMNVEDYIQFSKSIDVAVSLMMAPHPNYPTLEFASIGSAVVTTNYANKNDLSKYSRNIIMADPGIESVSNAIIKASKLNYKTRLKALETTNIEKSWDEALDTKLKQVLKLVI
jgi:hypothetical protein